MPEKELDYIRSTDAAGSTEKDGGIYIDAFDKQDNAPPKKGFAKFIDGFRRADAEELGIDLTCQKQKNCHYDCKLPIDSFIEK